MMILFKDFLLFSFFAGFSLIALWLAGKFLNRKASPWLSYTIHHTGIFLLLIPLLPKTWISRINISTPGLLSKILKSSSSYFPLSNKNQTLPAALTNTALLEDAGFIQNSSARHYFFYILAAFWGIGLVFMLGRLLLSLREVHMLRQSAIPIADAHTCRIWEKTLKRSGFMNPDRLLLARSPLVSGPVAFGLYNRCILLPDDKIYDNAQLTHVLLHELIHCRHHDYLWNLGARLMCCFYWFQPAVHLLSGRLAQEQELYCDYCVLRLLGDEDTSAYGRTLLELLPRKQDVPQLSLRMSGSPKLLKQRILQIAAFDPRSKPGRVKNLIGLILALLILVSGLFPYTQATALASETDTFDTPTPADTNTVSVRDFSSFFASSEGAFVLLDAGNDHYHIHNQEYAYRRFSPASTYKIYDTLFSLDAGIIDRSSSTRFWDGTFYPIRDWNQDQDLYSAMSGSANWYFEHLDRELGQQELEAYIERIGYGNREPGTLPDNCWIDSKLAISPFEQVNSLRALYQNEFGFNPEDIETVFEAITIYQDSDIRLAGKTGTGSYTNNKGMGWFIGFIEQNQNTFFFALYLEGDQDINGKKASETTIRILTQEGWLPTGITL